MTTTYLLRVEEAAEALQMSRSKLYEMIASGEIPSVTIGRSRRVPAEALRRRVDERLADQSVPPTRG
jgi:excisionase family DNA binding protein